MSARGEATALNRESLGIFFCFSLNILIYVLLLMKSITIFRVEIPPPQPPFLIFCFVFFLVYYDFYFYYVFLMFKTNIIMTQDQINYLKNTKENW